MARETYIKTRHTKTGKIKMFLEKTWNANKNKPTFNLFVEVGEEELPTVVPTERIVSEAPKLKEIEFKKAEEPKEEGKPEEKAAPKTSQDLLGKDAIAHIESLTTKEEVEAFTKGDTRNGVTAAVKKKLETL